MYTNLIFCSENMSMLQDIEAYVRKESAERRKEMGEVKEKLQTDEEKRLSKYKMVKRGRLI